MRTRCRTKCDVNFLASLPAGETVFNVVKETLERGEKIKISGFGNFVVRDKKDRMGRDPQRAVPILIPARRVLTFKPSQVLKNILNGLPPV